MNQYFYIDNRLNDQVYCKELAHTDKLTETEQPHCLFGSL